MGGKASSGSFEPGSEKAKEAGRKGGEASHKGGFASMDPEKQAGFTPDCLTFPSC